MIHHPSVFKLCRICNTAHGSACSDWNQNGGAALALSRIDTILTSKVDELTTVREEPALKQSGFCKLSDLGPHWKLNVVANDLCSVSSQQPYSLAAWPPGSLLGSDVRLQGWSLQGPIGLAMRTDYVVS